MTDVAVIGAGPNGLVAANILAQAGLDVLVCEEQPVPGGAVRSTDAIAPGYSDQNRLVVAAREELDLAPSDQVRDVSDDVGTVGFQPVKQRTGEVESGLYFGMPIKGGHEGGVRPLGHILEN